MMPNGKGAYPYEALLEMVDQGFIKNIKKDHIKPSSFDLPIGDEIYEVDGIFQVKNHSTVFKTIKDMGYKKVSIKNPLMPFKTYVIPIETQIDLPTNVYGYANPKSTAGRLNLHTRLMADNTAWYDSVKKGFDGKMWILVQPKSFPIILEEGVQLNQLRLFNENTRLKRIDLEILMQSTGILFAPESDFLKAKIRYKDLKVRDDENSLLLGLDLNLPMIGYKAKNNNNPIEYNSIKKYTADDYFETIEKPKTNYFKLLKGEFYILSTLEHVMIPPGFASEMAPMDDRLGDFRAHYAGFFDPGWGYGKSGEIQGRPITLEVCSFEDMFVSHGQPIGRIKIEKLTHLSEKNYDDIASNYSNQDGPKLAKQFKS